jgi:hypothetical protein
MMPRQASLPPAAAAPDNPDDYAANPAPRRSLLTMTMPDPPVNINGTRTGAALLHLFHATVCCSGDSATLPIAGGSIDGSARGAGVMCARSDRL